MLVLFTITKICRMLLDHETYLNKISTPVVEQNISIANSSYHKKIVN